MSQHDDKSPLEILKQYWGYDAFRELQAEIIDSVLAGNDTLALLPTGGGKSLTFQIPALIMPGIALVVTPLISLMKDQTDRLRSLDIGASYLRASMTRRETSIIFDKCRYGKIDVLYVSPEKLRSASFIDSISQINVSLIVVDEAHCISQWGYDFRPSYLKIADLRTRFPKTPVLALTASATPEVVNDIRRHLNFSPSRSAFFQKSFARDNISFLVRNVDVFKDSMLNKILFSTSGTAIVYTRSRRRTAQVAQQLQAAGISADFYHAGLDPEEKNIRQNRWMSGETRVMVATNAFGMGIDKPDVRVVVHLDLPPSLEEYYQEAGRAGRDGLPSYAVIIVGKNDPGRLKRMLTTAFPERKFIQRVYELVGNFLSIPMGEGARAMHPFNLWKFVQTYQLPEKETHSALSILSRAGWIDFVDETEVPARVMVTLPKEALYSIDLNPTEERVLTAVLRKYTGLFADYVPINETTISSVTGLHSDRVHESLVTLGQKHALSFIPRNKSPYVSFTIDRQQPKHITLPREIYELQRERMKQRLDAVRNFVFADDRCRVNLMLEWFGQSPQPHGCGKCDYCRAHKSA